MAQKSVFVQTLNKHSLQKMLSFKEASLLAIIGISLLFMESYLNFYQSGREGGFDNFASLILVCPIIFILFANQYVSGRSKDIAMYSTAIYLIHIFIMDILKEFTELSDSLLTISVIAASGLASFLIVEANRKLRVIL